MINNRNVPESSHVGTIHLIVEYSVIIIRAL